MKNIILILSFSFFLSITFCGSSMAQNTSDTTEFSNTVEITDSRCWETGLISGYLLKIHKLEVADSDMNKVEINFSYGYHGSMACRQELNRLEKALQPGRLICGCSAWTPYHDYSLNCMVLKKSGNSVDSDYYYFEKLQPVKFDDRLECETQRYLFEYPEIDRSTAASMAVSFTDKIDQKYEDWANMD